MNAEKVDKFLLLIILILVILFVTVSISGTGEYKRGQIDAINGKIYYELREMDNGEMKWRRIEGE